MSDETWLAEALRSATRSQPRGGDRATAALRLVARRRKQRVAAVSGTAAVAVFAALALSSGPASTGLHPVAPSPSASPTPGDAPGASSPVATPAESPAGSPASSAAGPAPVPSSGAPAGPRSTSAPGWERHPPDEKWVLPADVYFLVDAGVAERQIFVNVVDDVQQVLREQGMDVRTGLGAFADLSIAAGVATEPEYWNVQRVGRQPADARRVDSKGSPGSSPDPWGHALAQAVTNDGAGFTARRQALVVLLTDAAARRERGDPDLAEVVTSLRAYNVRVIGLLVRTASDIERARADLTQVVKGTGTLAWHAVDVDGDGVADLMPGDPLVHVVEDYGAARHHGFGGLVAHYLQEDLREKPR